MRKQATESGIAAELLTLLETVTADGTITEHEALEIRRWLEDNRDSCLPAIDFLRTTIEQILADGKVTVEERKALHRAVERVMPPELRERAKGRREAAELVEKAREREERTARRAQELEERDRNRAAHSANFMVAGVAYEGRAKVVDRHLEPGDTVFLARDPGNAYDSNAIEARLRQGYQIGYVPREDAREMAPLLDRGYKQTAYCTKILDGRRAPIPVVQVHLYRPDADVPAAIGQTEVPPRASPGSSPDAAWGCLIGLVLVIVILLARSC